MKKKENEAIKNRVITIARNLFECEKEDYYKPKDYYNPQNSSTAKLGEHILSGF